MGETRVDLHHLLEDLRDAYPGALEETILTEIVANALDSGARLVRITCDPVAATFVVLDDGSGMQRRDLARYHDIASSTKTRGQGIGFAGVGIKLGLLICEDVVTESRRGTTHVASRWHLASRHKAPWKWEPPAGLVTERGTAVQLRLSNPLSPLLDVGYVEAALRRHFQPLLEPEFTSLLGAAYPNGIRFEVQGRPVEPEVERSGERAPIEVRMARKRKPSAVGYLFREALPLPEERRGVAISTLGKTIKRGWDWLGVTPATPDRIGGLIEVPPLAEIGRPDANGRDLVATALLGGAEESADRVNADDSRESVAGGAFEPATTSIAPGENRADESLPAAPPPTSNAQSSTMPGMARARRPARHGLEIQFDERPGESELARLVESTVWINEPHPAFRRAAASRSEGYDLALSVAMALAPLAVEPQHERAFGTSFLERWGESLAIPGSRRG